MIIHNCTGCFILSKSVLDTKKYCNSISYQTEIEIKNRMDFTFTSNHWCLTMNSFQRIFPLLKHLFMVKQKRTYIHQILLFCLASLYMKNEHVPLMHTSVWQDQIPGVLFYHILHASNMMLLFECVYKV